MAPVGSRRGGFAFKELCTVVRRIVVVYLGSFTAAAAAHPFNSSQDSLLLIGFTAALIHIFQILFRIFPLAGVLKAN